MAAIFILPTQLRFAQADTRPELRAGFEALAAAVSPFCADADIVTETFWAALHGLVEFERSGRIRPGMRDQRIALVVRAIVEAGRNPQGRGSHYPVANRSSLVRASEAKTSPYGTSSDPSGHLTRVEPRVSTRPSDPRGGEGKYRAVSTFSNASLPETLSPLNLR